MKTTRLNEDIDRVVRGGGGVCDIRPECNKMQFEFEFILDIRPECIKMQFEFEFLL